MSAQPLIDWLRADGGFVHPDLQLVSTGASGDSERGIRTVASIQEGQELLRVPVKLCLHVNLVRPTFAGPVVLAGQVVNLLG